MYEDSLEELIDKRRSARRIGADVLPFDGDDTPFQIFLHGRELDEIVNGRREDRLKRIEGNGD